MVDNMVHWVGDLRFWDIGWRRDLFVWEQDPLANMVTILNEITLTHVVKNLSWKLDTNNIY